LEERRAILRHANQFLIMKDCFGSYATSQWRFLLPSPEPSLHATACNPLLLTLCHSCIKLTNNLYGNCKLIANNYIQVMTLI
jgi:hypothetical protein